MTLAVTWHQHTESVEQHDAERAALFKEKAASSVSGHTCCLIPFSSTLCTSYFVIFKEQRELSDTFSKPEAGELCLRERDDGHNHSTACSLLALFTPA